MNNCKISRNLYQNSKENYYYERTRNSNRHSASLKTRELNEAVNKREVLSDLFELISRCRNFNQYTSPPFYQACDHWHNQNKKTCLKSTIRSYQYRLKNYLFLAPFVYKSRGIIKIDVIKQWCESSGIP